LAVLLRDDAMNARGHPFFICEPFFASRIWASK
jgi:hypothetical protein